MDNHGRMVFTIVIVFLGSSVLPASPRQDQTIPLRPSVEYTSRSPDDAKAWQKDIRARLFQLLKLDDLIPKSKSTAFNPKVLSRAEMDQMEQNHCMCWKFEGLRELVDFADIYSLIGPRPLQCQNGLLEPATQFYVPLARQAMEEIRMIYRDLGKPENVVLDVHEEGHVMDLPGLVYFFDKHLYQNRRK